MLEILDGCMFGGKIGPMNIVGLLQARLIPVQYMRREQVGNADDKLPLFILYDTNASIIHGTRPVSAEPSISGALSIVLVHLGHLELAWDKPSRHLALTGSPGSNYYYSTNMASNVHAA